MGDVMTNFDPIAVGDQITAYELEAAKAKGSLLECSKKSGALLLDVQQNHPEHLEAIITRVGISRSRRYELLAIAGGRRTEEENKAISKARQEKKRAKGKDAKGNALPPPKQVPESVTTIVTDSPEASAERRKAEYAAMETAEQPEAQPEPVEPPKPDPTVASEVKAKRSDQALGEFKFAAKRWLRDMNHHDRRKAFEYVSEMMDRFTQELAA
jgi:hypothetical protein